MASLIEAEKFKRFLNRELPAVLSNEFKQRLINAGKDENTHYRTTHISCFISDAFNWASSPAGSIIWSQVNKDWQEKLQEKKIKGCDSIW